MRGAANPRERPYSAHLFPLAAPLCLSESGFTGLAGFSGFRFANPALFAATGNPAKWNMDERLPSKNARAAKNPENPIIPKILILTIQPRRAWANARYPKTRAP